MKTTTDLTVYDRYACAKVWSYKGTPYGSVTFTLSGRSYDTETVYLRYGKACVGLSRLDPGWYKLTARYNGSGRFLSSYDSEYFKVRGYGYYKHDKYDPDHHHYYKKDRYDDEHHYYKKDPYEKKDDYYNKHSDYSRHHEDSDSWKNRQGDDPKKCEYKKYESDSYSSDYKGDKTDTRYWCKDGDHEEWKAD